MTEPATDGVMTAEELHETGIGLEDGDRVLFNDRSRPLTVTGQHDREREKKYTSVKQGDYVVTELEGNRTEYHLLCWENPEYGPILYKEADWETTETDDGDTRYEYPRMGDRIEHIELTD